MTAMAQITIKDTTLERYRAVRARLRQTMGTSKVTQRLINMDDDDLHELANDLLELFDIVDPILGS